MGQTSGTTFTATPTGQPVPPLRTDMFDGSGMSELGNLTRAWFLYFQAVSAAVPITGRATGKYAQALTPAGTNFTITHNPNTTDVVVQVYNASGQLLGASSVTITITDANNVAVVLASSGMGRAVVVG